jgi:hypothetical protein
LSEALWAHRILRHGATKVTPLELVYDQEVVLPIEVNLDAYRLVKHEGPYKVIKVIFENSYLLETLKVNVSREQSTGGI